MPADARGAAGAVRLAIAIPAFGRADAIAASIAGMAEEARAGCLAIAFYVSDDTADDTVETALAPLIAAGVPLHYRRNRPPLRHDRNVLACLTWPDADHVWPIGSNFRAAPGVLAAILDFLDRQDMVFVNNHADDRPRAARVTGDAARALIGQVLWHQTLTGTTIYARSVCDWVAARGDRLTLVANFPQICTILGFASDNEVSIGWFDRPSLAWAGSGDGSYWRAKAIDVFARDWADAVAAFPAVVPPRERKRVTSEHSRRTNLFNTPSLIDLRGNGQFGWRALADPRVRRSMHLAPWKLLLVLALPRPVLRRGSRALAAVKRRLA